MSLVGLLDVGRSDRVAVDRTGTLRDQAQAPVDVVVENLSTTGCLFVIDRKLPLGALISLGIPGVGVRHARIARASHPHYACAFLSPISDSAVAAALSAETLVEGSFPLMPTAAVTTYADPSHEKFRLRTRLALLVGISAVLWAAIIAGVIAIAR